MPFIKFKLRDFINDEMGPEYETIINSDYIVNINNGEFVTLFWKQNIDSEFVTMSFVQKPSYDDLLFYLNIKEREYAFVFDKWKVNNVGQVLLSFKDRHSKLRARFEISEVTFQRIRESLNLKVFESPSDIEFFLGK